MLVGKTCKVGNYVTHSHDREKHDFTIIGHKNKLEPGFRYYTARIVSEEQMDQVNRNFYVLVYRKGFLTRVDTDFIYNIEM